MTIESTLNEVYTKVSIQQLTLEVQRLVQKIQIDMINSKKRADGYCVSIIIPEREVLNIFNNIEPGLTDTISTSFKSDWGLPKTVLMLNSPFYHILLFLILLGTKAHNDTLAKYAMNLMNFRLYNGRRVSSIPHCDSATMQYVLQNMMSKKFVCTKYETPFELITQYFTPTIYEKYKSYIQKDPKETKRLFEACFNRIRQIFRSNSVVDLNTGTKKYRSGLQPLYFDAKSRNLKVSTTVSNSDTGIDSSLTSHSIEEDIDSITNYIVMNHNPVYDEKFIDYLKSQSSAQKTSITQILNSLHTLNYTEHLREILESIFRRISLTTLCSPSFMDEIQSKVVSSKHTPDVNRIKDICDKLLIDIMKTKFATPYDYMQYSSTNRAQLRRIVIYGLAYNIQKYKCH